MSLGRRSHSLFCPTTAGVGVGAEIENSNGTFSERHANSGLLAGWLGFAVPGIKPEASHNLGKRPAIELCLHPAFLLLYKL